MKSPVCYPTQTSESQRAARCGFTLVEVMMGVGIIGVMMVSLYAALAFGFAQIRTARENVRATQILAERMEVVRLLNWDQVVNLPNYIPTTFEAVFYSNNSTNSSQGDFIYHGTVLVTNAPLTETYSTSMRKIEIEVAWQTDQGQRTRKMTTLVSQYGMQQYVY